METILHYIESNLPIENSILIFFIVLMIILFSPLILNRFRIPSLIGLVLIGAILGPNSLNVLSNDKSFEIFGSVGLLYLMFTAGLDMNLEDLKKNRVRSLTFGLYTFTIPMVLGIFTSVYLLKMNYVVATLLASMYASHTLITYPIVSKFGVSKRRSVIIAVGGTILTVFGALLILAIIAGMYNGDTDMFYWIRFGVLSVVLYAGIIFFYPRMIRWFFKKYDDNILQYIFVLSLVLLAAYLSKVAGMEGIIGAFIAGVVLNRYIPQVSPLMNRINFVGNALFIPYFLIGVGMLIDFRVLVSNWDSLYVAIVMTAVATVSKWLAAWFTQKTFRLDKVERTLIFGLSNAQAASTLAAVLIGYGIVIGTAPDGTPIRLLNENVLNGTIVMILVTCAISSVYTERAARKLALAQDIVIDEDKREERERILIPVANPETIDGLVNLAVMMRDPRSSDPLHALFVIESTAPNQKLGYAKKVLEMAAATAAASDTPLAMIDRVDINVSSGILNTIKERDISDIVVGLHRKANVMDTFFGTISEQLLKGTHKMLTICKCINPPNTVSRIVVAVPARAEFEAGFNRWVERLAHLTQQIGCRILFYGTDATNERIAQVLKSRKLKIRAEYNLFDNWEDLLFLTSVLQEDDFFVIISARKNSLSYHPSFERLPQLMARYFAGYSMAMLYPEQIDTGEQEGNRYV